MYKFASAQNGRRYVLKIIDDTFQRHNEIKVIDQIDVDVFHINPSSAIPGIKVFKKSNVAVWLSKIKYDGNENCLAVNVARFIYLANGEPKIQVATVTVSAPDIQLFGYDFTFCGYLNQVLILENSPYRGEGIYFLGVGYSDGCKEIEKKDMPYAYLNLNYGHNSSISIGCFNEGKNLSVTIRPVTDDSDGVAFISKIYKVTGRGVLDLE